MIIKTNNEKSFKEIFQRLLSEKVTEELKNSFGGYIEKMGKKLSVYDAMALVQLKKALDGDAKAFELIRDTLGHDNLKNDSKEFGGIVKVMITDE